MQLILRFLSSTYWIKSLLFDSVCLIYMVLKILSLQKIHDNTEVSKSTTLFLSFEMIFISIETLNHLKLLTTVQQDNTIRTNWCNKWTHNTNELTFIFRCLMSRYHIIVDNGKSPVGIQYNVVFQLSGMVSLASNEMTFDLLCSTNVQNV